MRPAQQTARKDEKALPHQWQMRTAARWPLGDNQAAREDSDRCRKVAPWRQTGRPRGRKRPLSIQSSGEQSRSVESINRVVALRAPYSAAENSVQRPASAWKSASSSRVSAGSWTTRFVS